MAWTEQQKNAIEARNSSIMVSAAAGSGKTAVLTERLAQLIADEKSGIRADRIVAVTFTNDAASELRKRLDKKLLDLIVENPGNRHLLKQQTLLQSARISTINSFCFELLRDNITDQGITSGFSIIDESDDNILKAAALDELINLYCDENYDDISYLYDKFCVKNDENLAHVISETDRYLSSVAFRSRWLDKAESEFEKNPYESIYFEKIIDYAVTELKKAARLASECCDMLDDIFSGCDSNKAIVNSYTQAAYDMSLAEKALNLFENKKIPDENDIKACTDFGNLVTIRASVGADTELRNVYKAKRTEFISIVKDTVKIFKGFEEEFIECGKTTRILCRMLRKYHEIIWEKKCEKNSISFDDGERLVLEFLSDFDENGMLVQSDTAKFISGYYDVILIDEYQDSNNKEDMIFKLISKNFRSNNNGEPLYGSNAFVVGDVKQSIYRFRLANPKNFINTLKNSETYSKQSDALNKLITLNKNFRSAPGVIDYVNYIFGMLMTENCGDVSYDDNEKLYFGAEEYNSEVSHAESRTQISLIPQADSNEKINNEAVYVAEKIKSMIDNGVQVVMKNGKYRPCEASDFCILTRVKYFSPIYTQELKKRGIAAKGEEETGYLNSREIAVLLDLLRIIDNPLLDVPLAAVMLSPMYMFELEELAFLRTLDRNAHLFTIINDTAANKYEGLTDSFFVERCSEFIRSLDDFRLSAVTMTVSELISDIYDTTDFVNVMQMLADGEKKKANLRALVQYAKSYEKAASFEGSGGLTGFVRYIDKIIENGDDFTQGKVSSSSGNYVSVKTIHKSKGLEYPFIFLAETSTEFRFDSSPAVCTDDGRIGYVLHNPQLVRKYKTSAYRQITAENKRDTISEEMRLFYVALTRAKQQLFINLKWGKEESERLKKLIESYFYENGELSRLAEAADSFSDWLWISVFNHIKFRELAEKLEISSEFQQLPSAGYNDEVFDIVYADSISGDGNSDEISEEIIMPEPELYTELKKIISFDYDTSLSETPSKLSVTQITKKLGNDKEFFDFKLKRPSFAVENNSLTGAERGTAIHTFFQYCDFENACSDAESEIARLIENGYLSKPQAESIDLENVAAFFESELFKRISCSQNIYREKKFMVAISDLDIGEELSESIRNSDGMIKGIVDLFFEENGKIILIDYKSDRGVSGNVLAERYTKQLKLYKSALELTIGLEVSEAYLYSFELKKSIRIPF